MTNWPRCDPYIDPCLYVYNLRPKQLLDDFPQICGFYPISPIVYIEKGRPCLNFYNWKINIRIFYNYAYIVSINVIAKKTIMSDKCNGIIWLSRLIYVFLFLSNMYLHKKFLFHPLENIVIQLDTEKCICLSINTFNMELFTYIRAFWTNKLSY